jgi:hypothetical protein
MWYSFLFEIHDIKQDMYWIPEMSIEQSANKVIPTMPSMQQLHWSSAVDMVNLCKKGKDLERQASVSLK